MAWNEPGGGGRDPWNPGGRKPGDGNLPDVDQVLERLKSRFKGKGNRPPGLSSGGAGLLAAAIVVMWALSGIYTVDAQERAVVLRFGAYSATAEPGPHWRLPWPIESVEKVNVTQVRQENESADILTQDENIASLDLKVQFRVDSAEKFLFSQSDPVATLREVTKAAVREVVGRSRMDFILTDGRQQVAEDTREILQERLDAYGTGLHVIEVNLLSAQAPDPVQDAFLDATKAREDQERLKNEAEAYANDRLPKAGGQAARQRAEAVAYRDQLIAQAAGEADRFSKILAEYRKAPRVTRDRLYLETMSEVLGNATKVVIDTDKNGPMLYLPLDQLNRASRAGEPGDGGASANQSARPGSTPDARARDRGGR